MPGQIVLKTRTTAAVLALFGAGLSGAYGAPADPDHGETLARRWCAACHIVADDQPSGADNVPTFAAIAAKPGFDATRIVNFLRYAHRKMPDMQLSTAETADLAAYIVSLKK